MPSEENANRKNGEIAYTYTIGPSVITGINEIISNDFIKIYPNPANTKIIIQDENNIQKYQVKLLNIMGEVILISNKKEIDIGSIPYGVYFLNFETEKYISSKKIVIQH